MADNTKVLTGAIALIKVSGKVVGLMKSIRIQESMRRQPVRGIGRITLKEKPVTEWEGTLTCDFMEVDFQKTGIPGAIRRDFNNATSQVLTGNTSFEDQLVLDTNGVTVEIYKKIADVLDSNGQIKPTLVPHAIVTECLIESESLDVSEGSVSGHNQTFAYLSPCLFKS